MRTNQKVHQLYVTHHLLLLVHLLFRRNQPMIHNAN
nr:MAG TPA: hypothetical protein [Caudoviricetes sp.]